MASARSAVVISLVLIAAACGSAGTTGTDDQTAGVDGNILIRNQGGTQEGHTPTGFAGTGTGLFAGDNLNPSFPEGIGVQIFLTFALPGDLGVGRAVLSSNALHTIGSPFDDLGALLAEPVAYNAFGPELFDLPAVGEPVHCRVAGDTTVECDVTTPVQDAIGLGRQEVQFRIRFERAADNDGRADLALFYRSDSNTNEPGLFELQLTATP